MGGAGWLPCESPSPATLRSVTLKPINHTMHIKLLIKIHRFIAHAIGCCTTDCDCDCDVYCDDSTSLPVGGQPSEEEV